jgi:hypothetical protein
VGRDLLLLMEGGQRSAAPHGRGAEICCSSWKVGRDLLLLMEDEQRSVSFFSARGAEAVCL